MKKYNNLIIKRSDCRICKSKDIKKVVDLGLMPLAGNFVEYKDKSKNEAKFPLDLYFCSNCKLVQVKDTIKPDFLFKKYNYSSSTIKALNEHFNEYSIEIRKKYKNKKKFKILEFGCNDGVLLSKLVKYKNFTCVGVDPSKNISNIAKKKSINIVNDYFNVKTANSILKKFDKFDYITASNVFAHIDDIHSVINASKILLKDNGVLVIEVHYLMKLLNLNQYDFFYHEHVNYYSILSIKKLFKIHNFEIEKIKKTKMHGGSLRVFLKKKKFYKKIQKIRIKKSLKFESKINYSFFKKFNKNILNQKKAINQILSNLKNNNKNIIGYGASGRGTTFLNYCNINNKTIRVIIDDSPFRAGKIMPGVKIPIKNFNYLKKNSKKIDFILIIAWNYKSSIINKVRKVNNNVKFIIPFPKPIII